MVMVVALKRGVLAFWALWLTIVTATNVTDLLRRSGCWGPTGAGSQGYAGGRR
jgi:hypothetical protein